jgi:hypothetical protein
MFDISKITKKTDPGKRQSSPYSAPDRGARQTGDLLKRRQSYYPPRMSKRLLLAGALALALAPLFA